MSNRNDYNRSSDSEMSDLLLYVIAFFIPPIPVLMRKGCGFHLFLNIVLTILAGIPGIIHACYVIYKTSYNYRGNSRREISPEHRQPAQAHHGQTHAAPVQQQRYHDQASAHHQPVQQQTQEVDAGPVPPSYDSSAQQQGYSSHTKV